ncbi:hypothetical protein OH781_39330 [Streptomyces sp. NBC_01550]|uniref:hypothetical protein n=1 Tax=unclassified Streptomyces TaxID=2593676 RepID=UPI0036C459A6
MTRLSCTPPTAWSSTTSTPTLSSRFARALIRTTLSRPGGTFYFSNIATPNPYAA